MGSGADQDFQSQREQAHQQQQSHDKKYKLKMLLLVIITNLLTIYIFTAPFYFNLSVYSCTSLLHDLNSTKSQLAASHSIIAKLLQKLSSTNLLSQALLIELTRQHDELSSTNRAHESIKLGYDIDSRIHIPDELMLAIGPHELPLGYSPQMGSDEVYPPVGAGCFKFPEELVQYMTYDIGDQCPVDDVLVQRLMLKGCEPLPRRRCRPKSPANYVEPTPFPDSLWATPPDTSIIWDPYTCKSYRCLIEGKNAPGYFDCKNCFDLKGREKSQWLFDDGGLDYGIDHVLNTKPHGTIRIGLDIGGGTATFAARMRERNVTIITSTLNLDGLIPIHVSVAQRLPFFENTLDIVHSMHILSNWIPETMLEFTLYDIYRVLRPGGLFWLDHFFCLGSQLNATYIPMLDRIGFKKLRWNDSRKLDRGIHKNEWYFSALLEKPMK
ncbi:hypothetical protein ACB092_01G432000 [Castanea dentata]